MVPDDFREFFAAVATTAGALVGLLFVAISVAPDPVVGPTASVRQQVRASTALLALLSPLVLALVALIPGANVGYGTVSYGCLGLLFAAASIRRLLSVSHGSRERVRAGTQLLGFGVVMGLEVYGGVRLLVTPRGVGGLDYVAGALIGSLGLGIDRAWELVGARQTGLGLSLRDLLSVQARAPAQAEAEPDD